MSGSAMVPVLENLFKESASNAPKSVHSTAEVITSMTAKSERTLILLQEIAALNDISDSGKGVDADARRRRRKEIGEEIKQLARKKKPK
jgi:hypothetical protein